MYISRLIMIYLCNEFKRTTGKQLAQLVAAQKLPQCPPKPLKLGFP